MQNYYAKLPLGTDALELILLQGTVVADATMRDYATVAAILAANTECTATNYARIVLGAGAPTVAVNNTTDVQTFTFSNPTWTSLGGATNNTINALIVAYRATSGAADSAKIPLSKHDVASLVTTGTNVTGTVTTTVFSAA